MSKRHQCLFLALLFAPLTGCVQSPEARTAKYLGAGKKLLQNHDPGRAILEFRNAVQASPRNVEAHYQLGIAYLAAGDAVRAVSSFRQILELDSKHAGAQLKLAQILAGVKDPALWKGSQERLAALLRESPENSTALHALALTEMHLGASKDAMQHLERALALAPHELTVAINLAQAKLQANDAKGAEEVLQKVCASSPKSVSAALVLGKFYESQNNLAKAEEQFRQAALLEPKNATVLFSLATLQFKSGRKQEAEASFKRLADIPLTPLRTLYGIFLFAEGRREEAIRELERVCKQDPEDRIARTRLVAAYQAMNRTPDAQKLLNDTLKKNPKDLDALLQRGELSLAAGRLQEADNDLNQVLHLKSDSAEVHYAIARLRMARGATLVYRQELTEVLRLDPSILPARIELAKSLLVGNEAKAALAALDGAPPQQKNALPVIEQRNWALLATGDSAQARKGIDQGLAGERTPDLLLQDAILKNAAGRYAEARQSLREALAKAPADIRVLRALVGTHVAQKQLPSAVHEVREHASKNPKSAEIQFFLGNLLLETGSQEEAKRAFLSVKALNPRYTPADFELARINLRQSNWTDARQQLTSLLTTQESPVARLWLGMLEASAGNHTAAIAAFRKVLDEQPNNATALNNLAYLLAEHGMNADEALKYAQRAQAVEPDTARVADTLGWVLYHKGLYDVAIKYLEKASAREATPIHKFHLAMAYMKAGDKTRGRSAFEAALRLDPQLPDARAAKELFR